MPTTVSTRVRRRVSLATRKHEEEQVHREVVRRLRHAKVWFFHTPNAQSNPRYRAKLYALGVSAGVPDLILVTPPPCGGFGAAALEIKAVGGVASKEQLAWLDEFDRRGWATAITYGLEETLAQLRAWGYLS